MPATLRGEIIRLAYEDPKIRPFLLPMVKNSSFSAGLGAESFRSPKKKGDPLLLEYLEQYGEDKLKKEDGTKVQRGTVLKNPRHELYDSEFMRFSKWRKQRTEKLREKGVDLTGEDSPYHKENKEIAEEYNGVLPAHRQALEDHYEAENLDKYFKLTKVEKEKGKGWRAAISSMGGIAGSFAKGIYHLVGGGLKLALGVARIPGRVLEVGHRKALTHMKGWQVGLLAGGVGGLVAIGAKIGLAALLGPGAAPIIAVVSGAASRIASGAMKRHTEQSMAKYKGEELAKELEGKEQEYKEQISQQEKEDKGGLWEGREHTISPEQRIKDLTTALTTADTKAKERFEELSQDASPEVKQGMDDINSTWDGLRTSTLETNKTFGGLISKLHDKKIVGDDNATLGALDEIQRTLTAHSSKFNDPSVQSQLLELEDHLSRTRSTLMQDSGMHPSNFGVAPSAHHQDLLSHTATQLQSLQQSILESNAKDAGQSVSYTFEDMMKHATEHQQQGLEKTKGLFQAFTDAAKPKPDPVDPLTGISHSDAMTALEVFGYGAAGAAAGGLLYWLMFKAFKKGREHDSDIKRSKGRSRAITAAKVKKQGRKKAIQNLTDVTSYISPYELDLARQHAKKDGSFDEEGLKKSLDRELKKFTLSAPRIAEIIKKAQTHMKKTEGEESEKDSETKKAASLRKRAIKLAYADPDIRPYLLPLLADGQ